MIEVSRDQARMCVVRTLLISGLVPGSTVLFICGQFWFPLFFAQIPGFGLAIAVYLRQIKLHPRPSGESDASVIGDGHLRRDLRWIGWPGYLIYLRWLFVLACIGGCILLTQ
jgi:hypothetical protein